MNACVSGGKLSNAVGPFAREADDDAPPASPPSVAHEAAASDARTRRTDLRIRAVSPAGPDTLRHFDRRTAFPP
jgi:hypothetical protein